MTLSPVVKTRKRRKPKNRTKEYVLPFRFAAVDLGSNSIKARVSEIRGRGNHEILWENKYPVRLGHETFLTGKLSREMIQDAVGALRKIKDICRKLNVLEISAVATSAVREASNRQQLVTQVEKKAGIEIEIIPGSEEARLIALGVLGEIPSQKRDYLIIDIGGGSTEIIFSNDYTIIETQSLPMGAVRMKELYIKSDPINTREYEMLQDHIRSIIKSHLKIKTLPKYVTTFGCAGTITSLVNMNSNSKSIRFSLFYFKKSVFRIYC